MDENPVDPAADQLDAPTAALAAAVLDIARHVDTDDHGGAPRWFALVGTDELMSQQPAFAALLDETTRAAAQGDPEHLTPIETESGASSSDPLDSLAEVAWPDIARGGAAACRLERIDADPETRARLRAEIGDGPLRAVVAVTAAGRTWSLLSGGRGRTLLGPRLVPQLVDALRASFELEG